MRKMIAALVTMLATFAAAQPAQAVEADPWFPTVDLPVYRASAADVASETVMQLEAPPRAWGVRRFARHYDEAVDGLTIRTTGSCAANPSAICVRVEVGSYGPEQMLSLSNGAYASWQGICLCVGAPDQPRVLLFNRATTSGQSIAHREVAAHELGHALGLGHHDSPGVTSMPRFREQLSPEEVAVLEAWFAIPRYRQSTEAPSVAQ